MSKEAPGRGERRWAPGGLACLLCVGTDDGDLEPRLPPSASRRRGVSPPSAAVAGAAVVAVGHAHEALCLVYLAPHPVLAAPAPQPGERVARRGANAAQRLGVSKQLEGCSEDSSSSADLSTG